MLANSGEEETCRRESATFVGEGELLESHVTCQISRILTTPPLPLFPLSVVGVCLVMTGSTRKGPVSTTQEVYDSCQSLPLPLAVLIC